jgi:hypothetical protein
MEDVRNHMQTEEPVIMAQVITVVQAMDTTQTVLDIHVQHPSRNSIMGKESIL